MPERSTTQCEGQLTELTELAQKHESVVTRQYRHRNPPQQIEDGYINQTSEVLSGLFRRLDNCPLFNQKYMSTLLIVYPHLSQHVKNTLIKGAFIYMSDYRSFSGTENQLNQISRAARRR